MLSSNRGRRGRDPYMLIASLLGLGLWLASIGPVRVWAARDGHRGAWVLGVAPSFLAAWTLAFWNAFAMRKRPLVSAAYAAAVVAGAEVVQLVWPRYTPDAWDVAAGVVGAATVLPLLLWRERQRQRESPDDAA